MFAVYFASDRSSSGKSTVTLAFSRKLKDEGYSLSLYKTGPDFIDPVILSKALNSEIQVKNLDPFLIPGRFLTEWFFKETSAEFGSTVNADLNFNGGDLNAGVSKKAFIAESAMGLYDGNSFKVAKKFKFPVVLVMDCKKISSTMASLIYGLKNYKKGINVCGVILNNISSERHYEIIRDEIKENVGGVEVFGYIKNDENIFSIKERHLGLIVPEGGYKTAESCKNAGGFCGENEKEIKGFEKTVMKIKETVFKNVDFKFMVNILEKNSKDFIGLIKKQADKSYARNNKKFNKNASKIKIAVALDEAFFFYYNFNFEILKSFGAEIVFFSPLKDRFLPSGIKAVYIGGGYPEIYAAALEGNRSIKIMV